MSLKVGVIGVGYLGQHHARIFSELDGVQLVALADIDRTRCEEIAAKYGCTAWGSHQEILDACDALSIITPTTLHYGVAMDCLRAGKHLFIEKPITDSGATAREIVEEARKRKLIVQVGHIERYNPAMISAAKMISRPSFIEAERLSPFLGRATDVDVTLDLMIHDIDIVLSLIGSEVCRIRAAGRSYFTDRIDMAKAWLDFENGAAAVLTATRLAQDKKRIMTVYEEDSFLSVDFQAQEIRRSARGNAAAAELFQPEKKEPLRAELEDFVGYVRENRKPAVSGIEATKALELALKITDLIMRGEKS